MTAKEFENTMANDVGCCICSTPIEPTDNFEWYGDTDNNAFCETCKST